ncbi:protealysin inhibitor emfourin [Intrasporangium sp. YIM S08009]|uniref:protealysin inhibitor emfourin n=1 Tax=Intrasporangium zincisolvens TaxID=3080018 RepID=UPI002B05C0D0|nr:protealysin inhibitor emfourin [Intrasporangium sp. YIM S08009]
MTATPIHRCLIVPPYMLEELARSAEPAVAAQARQALRHDASVRELRSAPTAHAKKRRRHRPGTPPAGTPDTSTPSTPVPERTIADAKGAQTTPGTTVRREGEAATSDPAVNEAYDGLGATWELWWQAYQRNSLDGQGLPLLATVHYGRNYDNAFWDGTQMVFGDGDGVIFERFTKSVDVIGHELAHGVTEHTAGLNYQGQSGALNESISDVFGVLVKQHQLGQSADQADWLVGADLLNPSVKGRALRDMRNPGTAYDDPRLGKDPQPADMAHYVDTQDDNGGVHINSGIPNRAFALAALAIGGNAWEDVGHIWYAVVSGDAIKPTCDFETFANLTVDAAATAHGDGSAQHTAVRDAWQQVGVLAAAGQAPAPGGPGSAGPGTAGHSTGGTDPATPPSTEAQVVLRRTGGFAGQVRERRVAIGELSERDQKDWQHLLAAPTLQRIAASTERTHPDAFIYSVVCDEAGCDVTIQEPHLPEAIHSLFERTLSEPDE